MINILHINSYYQQSHFYKNLYDRQIEDGLKISVYVPVFSLTSTYKYGDFTLIDKCFNKYDRLLFHYKHSKILHSIKQKYCFKEFDLIHAHSLFSNGFIAYKLYKEFNIPYIVAVRNTDVNVFFSKMVHLRKLGIEIMKNSKKIIFISPSYLETVKTKYIPKSFQKEFTNKAIVIPNGVDDFFLQNKYKAKNIKDKNQIKLLYVGEINKNKNVSFSAHCISSLNVNKNKYMFTVIGKISDKKIYDHIKKFTFIKYLSPQKKESLIKYYRDTDIFVMPSHTETFGLVYVEAMSQGTPVIYTKNQGFDNQFEDGIVGYAINPNSENDFSKAIYSILNNYLKISENCINLSENFSWNHIERKYKEIYYSIL